jgi:hypothetical protein
MATAANKTRYVVARELLLYGIKRGKSESERPEDSRPSRDNREKNAEGSSEDGSFERDPFA